MLVTELPTTLLKPYASSRVNNHVQTIAFIQLVDKKMPANSSAVELALCENVVTDRRRAMNGVWSKFSDSTFTSHSSAREAYLQQVAAAEKIGFGCLTSTGIFLPMNNTDLKHFRASSSISRFALEYGSALFDNIARWYVDEVSKMNSASSGPAPAASTSAPPVVPAVLAPSGAGDDFGLKLGELEKVLNKVVSAGGKTS